MSFGILPLVENWEDSLVRLGVGAPEAETNGEVLLSTEEREVGGVCDELYVLSLCVSNKAAAKISADATTLRSEEV